jgi:uncharacterized protein
MKLTTIILTTIVLAAVAYLLLNQPSEVQAAETIQDAVRNEDVEYVKQWLKNGGNPNFSFNDESLLYIATGPKGGTSIVQLLLDAGANPDVGAGDYTPLMNAASWCNLNSVKILLASGADYNAKLKNGKGVIDCVGKAGGSELKVIQYIEQFASMNPSDRRYNKSVNVKPHAQKGDVPER